MLEKLMLFFFLKYDVKVLIFVNFFGSRVEDETEKVFIVQHFKCFYYKLCTHLILLLVIIIAVKHKEDTSLTYYVGMQMKVYPLKAPIKILKLIC